MATTRSTTPRRSATSATRAKGNTTSRKLAAKSSVRKATDTVADTAGSFVDAVKARPIASAVLAAGAAAASALIWAKRDKISEQAGMLGEKASELGSKLGERASELGDKLSEQATALGGKVSERYAAATGESAKTQQEIAEEALSLKQTGDPLATEQSKVGAVSY